MKTCPIYKYKLIYETKSGNTGSIKLNAKSENDAMNLCYKFVPSAENIVDVRMIGEVK